MDTEGDNDTLYKLFQSHRYNNEFTGGNNSAVNPLQVKFNDTLKINIVATIKDISKVLPKGQGVVAFTCAAGHCPNLKNLCLFGCPLEVLKPGKQDLDDKSGYGCFA